LGKGRSKQNPLLVGSVKANIGHLEAAAGISGLIKVVLSMQQGLIPRQLHFEQPSPHIAWDRIPVKMVVEPTQWPNGETRTASVTALGMSGTNAHVVLESVAANHALVLDQSSTGDSSRPEGVEPRTHHLLVLSAKTDSGLTQVAKRYGDWFEESAPDIADACHTAAVGRKHWQHRAAIVVESADQATQLLRAIERGESASSLIQGQVCKSPKIAWMFSGEGSEYVGMGQNLYRTQPVFRAVVDRCDEQLWQDREGSLLEALFRDQTLLVKSTWRQPALFVLQAALAKLWQSWGVEPDIVLGDGLGQYAAACAAGVMTWEDGLRLVARRSRIMAEVPANAELVASAQHCESTASPELLDEFEQFADTFDYFPADRPLICNLSGDVVPVHRLLGGSHWKRHLAESRPLEKSVQTLSAHDCTLVLELGPDADLSHLAAACWTGKAPHFMPSMCRGQNETQCVLTALGQIYVNGIVPDFHAFDAACPRRKIQLPSYPFQRSRYWITDVSKYVNEKLHQRTSSPSEDQE
jgi:acyl transferase domain-containing protein